MTEIVENVSKIVIGIPKRLKKKILAGITLKDNDRLRKNSSRWLISLLMMKAWTNQYPGTKKTKTHKKKTKRNSNTEEMTMSCVEQD